MYGDFSRDTFDRTKHHRRVLMQQGRLMLDADVNEQAAILLHADEQLARAVAGDFAAVGDGFKIKTVADGLSDLELEPGAYLVGGMLCEHEGGDTPQIRRDDPGASLGPGSHLLYLEAWEGHVDPSEDETLADPAFANADPMGRSKVCWEVRSTKLGAGGEDRLRLPAVEATYTAPNPAYSGLAANLFLLALGLVVLIVCIVLYVLGSLDRETPYPTDVVVAFGVVGLVLFFSALINVNNSGKGEISFLRPLQRAELQAEVERFRQAFAKAVGSPAPDQASLKLTSEGKQNLYRGAGNRLYRVEIHRGDNEGGATFKWSSDNGATTFPITNRPVLSKEGDHVELTVGDAQGRLAGVDRDAWFELVEYGAPAGAGRLPLLRLVQGSQKQDGVITLKAQQPIQAVLNAAYFLRVWDHRAPWTGSEVEHGALKVPSQGKSVKLEDGLEVAFEGSTYRAGDHWCFAVRHGQALPSPLPGRPAAARFGAPLAVVTVDADGKASSPPRDLRLVLTPLVGPP